MSGLKIQSLSTQYGQRTILHNITVPSVTAGQVVMILGPNGSGKSTLLKALAGIQPCKGKLFFQGQDLSHLSLVERANLLGYLPQILPQGTHLRVIESIKVAAGLSNSNEDWQRMLQVLQQLHIESLALHYLDELSGGQKQLVGLAQLLVRQPKIWLLDEPLSALDLHHQFQVMEVVKQQTKQQQLITLVIVHDINIALRYADEILFLKQGKLIEYGGAQQIISSELLENVYAVKTRIEYCSQRRPYVVIDGMS